jgi:hypothetical protein
MDHLHQESKISVGPSTGEFTPGFSIEGHGKFGGEYDTEVANMSAECKSAAFVFGLRLTLTDASVGPQAVETLNQLKEMAMGSDQIKEIVDSGLDITFRHEGTTVFINVRVPETLPAVLQIPGFSQMDLTNTVYSGKNDFKITTGACPTKFLTGTVEEIVERVSNFSLEATMNFEELHHVITALVTFAKGVLPQNDKKVNMFLAGVNILTAFRSSNFEFKYDPLVVRSTVAGLMNVEKSGSLEQHLANNQGMANGFLPQAQMMAPMFIGPYTDLLKAINLGKYEFFAMVPRLRLYICPGMTVFGLNEFINDKFLSQ